MKRVTRVLLVCFVASLLLGVAFVSDQPVWAAAGTQVPDPGDLLGVNPAAKGRKVTGTLSIFYTESTAITCDALAVDLNIAMRAKRRVGDFRSEGETVRGVCYEDLDAQRIAVLGVIENGLLPKLFPNGFTSFAVKAVDNLFQDENGTPDDVDPFFMITDFTLAVKAPGPQGNDD